MNSETRTSYIYSIKSPPSQFDKNRTRPKTITCRKFRDNRWMLQLTNRADFPMLMATHWGTWNIWSAVDLHSAHSPAESERQKPSELPLEREREIVQLLTAHRRMECVSSALHKHSLSVPLWANIYCGMHSVVRRRGFWGSKHRDLRNINGCVCGNETSTRLIPQVTLELYIF